MEMGSYEGVSVPTMMGVGRVGRLGLGLGLEPERLWFGRDALLNVRVPNGG
jgi:hypothetical protein